MRCMISSFVYDMPHSVTSVTDAQIMAAKADGVIFVVSVSWCFAKRCCIKCERFVVVLNANILGFVLTN